jgi:hypothetical protein
MGDEQPKPEASSTAGMIGGRECAARDLRAFELGCATRRSAVGARGGFALLTVDMGVSWLASGLVSLMVGSTVLDVRGVRLSDGLRKAHFPRVGRGARPGIRFVSRPARDRRYLETNLVRAHYAHRDRDPHGRSLLGFRRLYPRALGLLPVVAAHPTGEQRPS